MCSAVSVARRIPTQTRVLGVTSVGDELFVLLAQEPVAVYSIADYRKLRNFSVAGYKSHDENDMTSCVQLKRLYISDFHNNAVHSYQLGTIVKWLARRHVKKWDVGGSPLGLSVTPTCSLLVVCGGYSEHKKLVELKADTGELVREIALHRYIRNPHHSIQPVSYTHLTLPTKRIV